MRGCVTHNPILAHPSVRYCEFCFIYYKNRFISALAEVFNFIQLTCGFVDDQPLYIWETDISVAVIPVRFAIIESVMLKPKGAIETVDIVRYRQHAV